MKELRGFIHGGQTHALRGDNINGVASFCKIEKRYEDVQPVARFVTSAKNPICNACVRAIEKEAFSK